MGCFVPSRRGKTLWTQPEQHPITVLIEHIVRCLRDEEDPYVFRDRIHCIERCRRSVNLCSPPCDLRIRS